MAVSLERALSDGDTIAAIEPEFIENLQPHDGCVTPVLQFIRRHALQGVDDEAWYEEQLHFLLERMQRHRQRLLGQIDALRLTRATTRREVFRRIGYGPLTSSRRTTPSRSIWTRSRKSRACRSITSCACSRWSTG